MKKNLAVLITGAPRGNRDCIESIKRFTRQWSASFFCVLREEFLNNGAEDLREWLPSGTVLHFISESETQAAITSRPGYGPNVVKMWHEIWAGINLIPKDRFDAILRIRPDIFVGPGKLPTNQHLDGSTILTPEEMSYSGVNDMVALGSPAAMNLYANIFEMMPAIRDATRSIPEFITAVGLRSQGVTLSKLDIDLCLYRKEILGHLPTEDLLVVSSDPQLRSLAEYKIGGQKDSPQSRQTAVELINEGLKGKRLFPLFQPGTHIGFNGFYPGEIDKRDGAIFRFCHAHSAFWVDIDSLEEIKFTIHYGVEGLDPPKDIKMHIDGVPLSGPP